MNIGIIKICPEEGYLLTETLQCRHNHFHVSLVFPVLSYYTLSEFIFPFFLYIYIYIYISTTDMCFGVLTPHQCSLANNDYRQPGANLRPTDRQSSSQPARPLIAITFRSRILTVINIHTISVFFGLKLASRSSECSIEFCKQSKSYALTLAMKDSYNSTPRRVLNQIMGQATSLEGEL